MVRRHEIRPAVLTHERLSELCLGSHHHGVVYHIVVHKVVIRLVFVLKHAVLVGHRVPVHVVLMVAVSINVLHLRVVRHMHIVQGAARRQHHRLILVEVARRFLSLHRIRHEGRLLRDTTMSIPTLGRWTLLIFIRSFLK